MNKVAAGIKIMEKVCSPESDTICAVMGLIQNVNESSSGLKTLIIYSFLLFTILHIYAGKTWNRYKRGKGKI